MEAILKRHFWIVSALATVVVAYFVAGALGEMILTGLGGKVDLSQAPPRNIGADAVVAPGFDPSGTPVRLDDLLAGNLFDMPAEEPGADAGEEEAVDAGPPPDVALGPASTTISPCAVAAKVLALIAGPESDPSVGFATLEVEGKQQEYRIGFGVAGRTLSRISWNRVYLADAGGVECFLDIRYPDLASAAGAAPAAPVPVDVAKPPEPAAAPAAAPSSREDRFREAVAASVESVSDTERNVQRSLINTILDNQDLAMRQARVMPHEQGGEVVGFKVYGIRRDSLFGTLGMENGDLVQSINGIPMTGADKALQAYGRLRQADRIEVTVTRRGQQMNLVYNIR